MTLLQYKPKHYARYVEVPKDELPNKISYLQLAESDPLTLSYDAWSYDPLELKPQDWDMLASGYNFKQGGEHSKKYVLLELKRHTVRYRGLKTEYVLVQTQDPRQTDIHAARPIIVWVQADWVEPMTRHLNYEDELKDKLLERMKEKWKKK